MGSYVFCYFILNSCPKEDDLVLLSSFAKGVKAKFLGLLKKEYLHYYSLASADLAVHSKHSK